MTSDTDRTATTASTAVALPPLLPLRLSIVGGLTDVTTFVLIDGMFSAHITGNLVVLAADAAAGRPVHLATVLAVPFFVLTTAAVTAAVTRSARAVAGWIHPLAVVQCVLLAAAAAVSIAGHASAAPAGGVALAGGLLAVAAMATQNALLHLAYTRTPSTAVMTGNVVEATITGVRLLIGARGDLSAADRAAWRRTWPLIVGFVAGCVVGGVAGGTVRDLAWLLPVGAALVVTAYTARYAVGRRRPMPTGRRGPGPLTPET